MARVLGSADYGVLATALTFLGINPFWEKAIQGVIILLAVASDAPLETRLPRFSQSLANSLALKQLLVELRYVIEEEHPGDQRDDIGAGNGIASSRHSRNDTA